MAVDGDAVDLVDAEGARTGTKAPPPPANR